MLCTIIIGLSLNIYLSYKGLYSLQDDYENSIVYTATAQTSFIDSSISENSRNIDALSSGNLNKSKNTPDAENLQKDILINIIILILLFISLSSMQNFVFNIERRKNMKNLKDYEIKNMYFNKNHNKLNSKLIRHLDSKEDVT